MLVWPLDSAAHCGGRLERLKNMNGYDQTKWIAKARRVLREMGYYLRSDGSRWTVGTNDHYMIVQGNTAFSAVEQMVPITQNDELKEMTNGL